MSDDQLPNKTPRWPWMLTIGILTVLIIPFIVAAVIAATDPVRREQWLESFEKGEASQNTWVSLRDRDTDALVFQTESIYFALYCTENNSIAALAVSRAPFDQHRGFEFRTRNGELRGYGSDWGCSDLEHCSTEAGNGVLGALPFVGAADGGGAVTMLYHMADGSTNEVTYDFSGVRDRYRALAQRCAG